MTEIYWSEKRREESEGDLKARMVRIVDFCGVLV